MAQRQGNPWKDYWKSPDAGRANGRIMEVMWALDNIGSMRESLRHDIWELLRAELPSTKRLNQFKRVYSFPELEESHPFTEHAQVVFVILKDGIEGRSQESALYFLTRAVLQLRLAERAGNLPQFIACLAGLSALRIPVVDEMNPILADLSTSLSAHVRSVFSHVRLQGRTFKIRARHRRKRRPQTARSELDDGQLSAAVLRAFALSVARCTAELTFRYRQR